MAKIPRPLWQLLLLTNDPKMPGKLTCEECIALLAYDTELLLDGAELDEIRPAINKHLSQCSKCQAKLASWLEKQYRMERFLDLHLEAEE
jgi:hypothetical protein